MEPLLLKVNEEIELIQLTPKEAEMMFKLVEENRPFLGKWLPWVSRTRTVDDERKFLTETFEGRSRPGEIILGIFIDKILSGAVSLNGINKENNSTEFGYWLAENANGKGVMTESVKRLMKYCFEDAKINRVGIYASVNNMKSRAVIERTGCKFEGILRNYVCVDGIYHDVVMYSMLAGEFSANA